MTEFRNIDDDLEPGTAAELIVLAEQLRDQRPLPSPGFRGELRRCLQARSERVIPTARLRSLIFRYATAGTTLLVVGALSAVGVGPLG